jgi:hypothetical protein
MIWNIVTRNNLAVLCLGEYLYLFSEKICPIFIRFSLKVRNLNLPVQFVFKNSLKDCEQALLQL